MLVNKQMIKYIILNFLFSIYLKAVDAGTVSCNFDQDWCGYEPNKYFIRQTGRSPSPTSGPQFDKTTGDEGYYALCSGNRLRQPKAKCELSNDIVINKQLKFSFWYYMYGATIGTLELKRDEEILWSKTGRQKNEWLFNEITLEPGSFKLMFSANRSELGRFSSDIAIDDISLENQICN